ncbi:MAG: hypothetical protein IIA67_12800 [Planctomycetes bacterium]|nr:hypothetical protein [Planctomycetota bacterium]
MVAALFVAAAFVAGRWSTMDQRADELVSLRTLDEAVGQVFGEPTQVVEVASSSAAPSLESSPEPVDSAAAVPVASAVAADVDIDVTPDVDAVAVVIETSRDELPDVAGARLAPVDTIEISSKIKDEPNEPLSSLVATAKPQAVCVAGQCKNDRKFGTTLSWAETPGEAAQLAAQQGKLVFVIQVSGNFARDEFT